MILYGFPDMDLLYGSAISPAKMCSKLPSILLHIQK